MVDLITLSCFPPCAYSIILSIFIFKDRIGLIRGGGILLALLGVGIIALAGPQEAAGPYFWLGVLMIAGAAMSVAHGLYYWLLQRLPIYVVATSGLLTSVFGMSGAIILLKEPFTGTLFIGAVLTLMGVGLILWRNNRAGPKPAKNIAI